MTERFTNINLLDRFESQIEIQSKKIPQQLIVIFDITFDYQKGRQNFIIIKFNQINDYISIIKNNFSKQLSLPQFYSDIKSQNYQFKLV
ncbi:unnamed protein product [Paramecium octaurelia]|uniref:Uncharacterized protein n=1 Tax=Paramecium octaurelia TaxID=43137 RepID=A0A8S1UWU0_PAROT|nr:unnamed protein product [Paramecium octaurelia]